MDLEKIAEASHQGWFVAMAKQGWIFGPRMDMQFKTHPWLKPYPTLSDVTKEIVRAQVRGTLAALEAQGYIATTPGQAPRPLPVASATPATRPATPAQPVATPAATATAPAASSAAPAAATAPASKPAASAAAEAGPVGEVLERKVDASGRMRIGAGLVKKAQLLTGGATQVAIVQTGNVIEVLRADAGDAEAFYASVNPDGFMLPKAMLSTMGATDFTLTLTPGRLVVKPK